MLRVTCFTRPNLLAFGLLVLSCAVPLPVVGQAEPERPPITREERSGSPTIGPGSHVRVTRLALPRRLTGWVEAIDDDQLLLAGVEGSRFETDRSAATRLVRVPIADIERLEVRTARNGKKKSALIGGLVGGFGGLLGGLALYNSNSEECSDSWFCFDDLSRASYALGGAVMGGLVGALVGYAVGGDGWQVVSTEGLRVKVALHDGIRLSLLPERDR